MSETEAIYFPSPDDFRAWLAAHHGSADELWVGYFRKDTGEPTLTWPESVDVALCFGWIDGIRKKVDDRRYRIRFTPRRERSRWSRVNLDRYQELLAAGLVAPAGEAAFARGSPADYSYEEASTELCAEHRQRFEECPEAWQWFSAQPPGYRRKVVHWVNAAKRAETRARRLEKLVAACAEEQRLY